MFSPVNHFFLHIVYLFLIGSHLTIQSVAAKMAIVYLETSSLAMEIKMNTVFIFFLICTCLVHSHISVWS